MDAQLLKTAGQIAGIGGLALGVFFLLFKDLLKKIAAPGMTKEQWFRVVIIFMVLVWSVALAGVGAWLWVSLGGKPRAENPGILDLSVNQELGKFREVLWLPPRTNQTVAGRYPDPYKEGNRTKWTEPRRSSVAQITRLAELHPVPVVRGLVALFGDSDAVITVGALLAVRDILTNQPQRSAELKRLVPSGYGHPLDLRSVHVADEDFSVFSGTEVFCNAVFAGSVMESVKFDGLLMKGCDFSHATVLYCSFKQSGLEATHWDGSLVRATAFEKANLFHMYAEGADFGTASSQPTTIFPPVVFYSAILNDAVLNRSVMVGARFHNAKLVATQVAGVDFTGAVLAHDEPVTLAALRSEQAMFVDEAKYAK